MKKSSSRCGHRPIFPSYTRSTNPYRRLAIIKRNMVVEVTGEVHKFTNASELADILYQNNLLTYIQDFTEDWFLDYIKTYIRSPTCNVMANRYGDVSSIKMRFGKTTRWLDLSSAWGEQASVDFLERLEHLYQYLNVGYHHSPGSLGTEVLRQSWRENKLDRHTSPSSACCQYIFDNQTGGRVDTPGLHRYYDFGLDYDQASAHLAENQIQPTKTAIRYNREPSERYFTWFGKCRIKINYELALGPFPVRTKGGRVVYPTLPGVYESYIWKEQYEKAIAAGCEVECHGGYGWLECTLDTQHWCQYMYEKKVTAPEEYLEDYMKNVIVSTIGRYGMKPEFRTIVHEDDAEPQDNPIITRDGSFTEFCIHLEKNDTAVLMPHWLNYTTQCVALDTYEFALPYAERGELIATNYDSVLVLNTNVKPNTVSKYNAITCPPGTWRYQMLTGIYIPAPRAIVCNEKTRLPGVSINSRVLR